MTTVFDVLRQAMSRAEVDGMAGHGVFGEDREPCTYWILEAYIIIHLTDDEDFDASMLPEDMMDDLIIEER